MAAGAWIVYKQAKKRLGNGTLDLSAGVFRLALHTSGATEVSAGSSISTLASVGSELAAANNYASGGFSLDTVSWTFSGNNVKFDSADEVMTASGGAWNSVLFAVIHKSGGIPICVSTLSTASFAVGDGSTLTIAMNASGIFVLS